MYKIAICDSSVSYLDTIEEYITTNFITPDPVKILKFQTITELLHYRYQLYDLVFLTLQASDPAGIETARQLREQNTNMVIVLTSTIQQPTPETFKVQPFRFLIKSKEHTMLKQELPSILKELVSRAHNPMLAITKDGLLRRIPISSILYVSIAKHGAVLHTYPSDENSCIACRETIKEVFSLLEHQGFVYAHNSYIVNMCHIVTVNKNFLLLTNQVELSISRSRKQQFDEVFASFLDKSYKRKSTSKNEL